jgi:WD40 repeat protein
MLVAVSDSGRRDDPSIGLDETAASGPSGSSDAHAPTLATGTPPAAGHAAGEGVERLPEVPRGRYQLGAEVGRGGLGRVWRAHDVHLDRAVAIKELHADGEDARRRFVREALITARLEHPGIVAVHEAGRWPDGEPFYAMKLVRGRPLATVIDGKRKLDERLALVPTVLAVADAVAYAHSERIVHRDLKPHNVLVGEFGETVVIDWGLAKDLRRGEVDSFDGEPRRLGASPDETVAGSVIGTPAYMPPEQAVGEPADARADVYAIGAILYHVLAGVPPHTGKDLDVVIAAIRTGAIVPVSEREPSVPRDLAAIVGKAMARDKAARYPTARELADDLRRFQTGQLVGAHHYTTRQRVARWLRRHRALAVAAALALAVGGVSVWRVLAERGAAMTARDRAVAAANRAGVAQARAALAHDPALALAWLHDMATMSMSSAGPEWDAARVIAADALAQVPAQHVLRGHRARPRGLRADGMRVVTWDAAEVRVWDLAALTSRAFPVEQTERARPCTDPRWIDGHRTVAGGTREDFAIDLQADPARAYWSSASGTPNPAHPCRPAEEDASVAEVRMSRKRDDLDAVNDPLGRYVVAAHAGRILLQDAADPEPRTVRTLDVGVDVRAIRYSRDGAWFAATGADGGTIWSLAAAGEAMRLRGQRDITGAAFLSDHRLVTVGGDRALRIWVPREPARRLAEPATAAAVDPTTGGFVTGGRSGLVSRIGRDGTEAAIERLGPTGSVDSIAVAADGRIALALGREVWATTGGQLRRLGLHAVNRREQPLAVAWLGAADVASWDGESVWIWKGGESLAIALPPPPGSEDDPGEPRFITQNRVEVCDEVAPRVEAAATGAWVAVTRYDTGACDGTVFLVDVAGRKTEVLAGAAGEVAFTADGARLATATPDGAVLIWDVAARTPRRVSALLPEPHAVRFLAGDRRLLVTAASGGAVLDVAAGTVVHRWSSPDVARGAWLSPDGEQLVVPIGDDAIRIVSIAIGEHRDLAVQRPPLAVVFDPDGLRVVTERSVWTVRDDLPRDPGALAAHLARLPYRLVDGEVTTAPE